MVTHGTFHAELIFSSVSKWLPERLHGMMVLDLKQATVPLLMPEPDDIQISVARLLCNLIALGFSLWYAFTKHFLANNGMGLSYSIEVSFLVRCLLNL